MMEYTKPFLCKVGLHAPYKYLPRVSGDLGEIAIACKRCGYGKTFDAGWIIHPKTIQEDIAQEAQIEFGGVVGIFRRLY